MNKIEKATTFTIIITFIIIVILCARKFNRDDEASLKNLEYLEMHGEITRGIITGKDRTRKGGQKDLGYYYFVKGKKIYQDFDRSNLTALETRCKEVSSVFYSAKKGNSFLVLYDKLNPENSFLMLNCPIINSKDLVIYSTKYALQ